MLHGLGGPSEYVYCYMPLLGLDEPFALHMVDVEANNHRVGTAIAEDRVGIAISQALVLSCAACCG